MYGICPACGSELDDEGNCWRNWFLGDYYAYLSDLWFSIR